MLSRYMLKLSYNKEKYFLLTFIFLIGCKQKQETIKPVFKDITESVYASGILKSKNQYQAFTTVSGIVDKIYTEEGENVEVGSPILSIVNNAQNLMTENARLSAEYNALSDNRGKLDEVKSLVNLARNQMQISLSMLDRQRNLWSQNIGTKVELEQRELAYENAKNNYQSAKEKQQELERQLKYLSKQSQNNLLISSKANNDYLVKSKIKGKVYDMKLTKGEIVGPQTPIAIIGDNEKYLLEMQIDEYDIISIHKGMKVFVVLNSYKDSVYTAIISNINPIMNLQSKTFTIEAEFVRMPSVLYPNVSFEANVLIHSKKNAMLIPRNYLLNDSLVVNKDGKKIKVKTGLKDYQMIEILSGLNADEELVLPEQ